MRTSLLLLISLSAFAQTASFSGRVLDPDRTAVSNATIRLLARDGGGQLTATSAADGAFRFEKVPSGEYVIRAETRDLESPEVIVITLANGENKTSDISVAIRGVTERITVTAENSPVSLDEIAKSVTVIGRSELDRRQIVPISDAIRTVPGMRVMQLGGPGAFTQIMTRGLRPADTGVLIDGMRFRDVAAPFGDATGFVSDLLAINSDRVEILRGPASSLYGTNAIGGVVQLVSDQGGGPFHGEVLGEGGGLGYARGLARFSGSAGTDQRFIYSGGLSHLNVSSGVDGQDPVHNTSGQVWAQYRIRPQSALSARYFGNDLMLGVNGNPQAGTLPPGNGPVRAVPGETFFPAENDPDRRRESNFNSAMLRWTEQASSWATIRASYQALLSNRADINGPGGGGFQPLYRTVSGFNGRIDTAQARVDITRWRTNLFTGGYEWEREAFASPSHDENPDPSQRVDAAATGSQRSNALFVQDQMRLLKERLIVSLSGRWQNFHLTQPTFRGGFPGYDQLRLDSPPRALTGDAAVAYLFPATGTKIRAHVGNSYRVPSLYERFGTYFFGGSFYPIGDPRLSPERAVSVDAGFDQYFASNRWRVSSSYFYTSLQNVIAYGDVPNDPFGRFGGYLNARGGIARGVEVSAQTQPWRGMTLLPSYTYTNTLDRTSILTDGSIRGIRILPHMFQLVAMQDFGRRTQVSFDLVAGSEYISGAFFVGSGSRPFIFPGPRQANLAASYTHPVTDRTSLQFYGRILNVFNQTYFEDGYKTPKAWGVAGVKVLF